MATPEEQATAMYAYIQGNGTDSARTLWGASYGSVIDVYAANPNGTRSDVIAAMTQAILDRAGVTADPTTEQRFGLPPGGGKALALLAVLGFGAWWKWGKHR